MILSLIPANSSIIHGKIEPVDFTKEFDFDSFENDMIDTLVAHQAFGLSANQVGLSVRAFVLAAGTRGVVIYNPRIVDRSEASQELEEGCLTYPGLILKVNRSRIIKVRYADKTGSVVTKTFQDFTARTFQHELDHLDGVTFIDRQDGLKKDFAKKRWAKLCRLHGSGPAKIQHRAVDTSYVPDYGEILKRARYNESVKTGMTTSDEEVKSTPM